MKKKQLFYCKFISNYGYFFEDALILKEYESSFQKIIIYKTDRFGKIMNIDGFNNHSEEDSYIYDEIITHIPLCAHPKPNNILVIGGGSCTTNREILKHKNVKKIVMVDIDESVIKLHKEYFGTGVYEDPRLEIKINDAAEFVKKCSDKFDIIINDCTDPPGQDYNNPASNTLFSIDFYQNCFNCLEKDGIYVMQSDGACNEYRHFMKEHKNNLNKIFPIAKNYTALIPSLYPGPSAFTIASKKYDPSIPTRSINFKTKYYSHDIHKSAFVLPPDLKHYISDTKNE